VGSILVERTYAVLIFGLWEEASSAQVNAPELFFSRDPQEEGLRLAQEGSQEVSYARKIIEILMKLKFRLNKLSCKSFKNFETDLLFFFLFPYLAQHYCRKHNTIVESLEDDFFI